MSDTMPASNDERERQVAAQKKWKTFHVTDPLKDIPRTLLSGPDIKRYAEKVGLIHPFFPTEDRLKAASYEVGFGTRFIYWDEDGKKIVKTIRKNDIFTLLANSISFVDLESEFLLPRYIGARFNLRIQHVHRGLLLGTGPLVDPGFGGNLLVPLHNLTSDPYNIRGDEGFIWVEFTKTSYKAPDVPTKEFDLEKWEKRKNDMQPEVYFDKANKNRPIRSSIPVAFAEATKLARSAQKSALSAERANRIFVGLGILAIAGTVLGLFAFFEAVKGNVNSAVTLATTVNSVADNAASDAKSAREAVQDLKSQMNKISSSSDEIRELRANVDRANLRIDFLTTQLRDLKEEQRKESIPAGQ